MQLSHFTRAKQLAAERQSFGKVKASSVKCIRVETLDNRHGAQVAPSTTVALAEIGFKDKYTETRPQNAGLIVQQSQGGKPEPVEKQSQSALEARYDDPKMYIAHGSGFAYPIRC